MRTYYSSLCAIILALVVVLVCGIAGVATALRFGAASRRAAAIFEKHHLTLGGGGAGKSNSTTHFYEQAILDHFGGATVKPRTWRQRFYVDESLWGGESYPVFVYIGGEGPQGPVSDHLFMYTLAKRHKALVVALEHRYYGESQPVADMTTANLKWLTSEQALADLARFRNYLASAATTPGQDTASDPPLRLRASAHASKFVAFGGSYPGNLAAWVKLKYPALFAGTVSSSAPVYAEYNYEQYAQVVGFALGHASIGGSRTCVDTLTKGVAAARQLGKLGNWDKLPESVRPCAAPASAADLVAWEADLFAGFQGVVQYNLESPAVSVAQVCEAVASVPGTADPLKALGAASALFANQSLPFSKRCLQHSYEDDVIKPLRNTTFDGHSSMRQWIYQSCNEFGYFQTTTGKGHPFSALIEGGIELLGRVLCEQAYDLQGYTAPNTKWANTNYGNRAFGADGVTFVNGNADPWHALGIVNASDKFYNSCTGGPCTPQHIEADDKVVFMDGTAHCRDMYAPGLLEKYNISDTPDVVHAHAAIAARVAGYLA